MRSIPFTIPAAYWRGKCHTLLLLVLGFALLSLSGCAGKRVRSTQRSFGTVIVDAGHGGTDRGTYVSRRILEKDAALDIAQKVNSRLRGAGFQTVMVRNGDYFVPLDDRVEISNRVKDAVFVSVHLNESRPRPGVHGVETYYFSGESAELARRILLRVGSVPGSMPRFMKTARFRVLRNNKNPAVLVECGYLSNKAEAARFASAGYRSDIAEAIATAIIEQRRR